MFHVVINVVIILMWLWIGYMTACPKMRKMKAVKDEYDKRQHKGELIQYALVYIMMMLLLIEKVADAIINL